MREDSSKGPLRVGMISLGCAKNLVDAEIMLGALLKDGVEIMSDSRQADVVIVNTCSFIDSAQEESVDTILGAAKTRGVTNREQGLIVTGCLPQRFCGELPGLLPEVDAFVGIDQVGKISEIVRQVAQRRATAESPKFKAQSPKSRTSILQSTVHSPQSDRKSQSSLPLLDVNLRPRYIPDYATPRFRLTPRHLAYVKIAEGCNHPCSFCIIPSIRGSHRSRSQADIVEEARHLIAEGVKELNLISQDSTYYGLDLRANRNRAIAAPERFATALKSLPAQAPTICSLLQELNALPGDFWIRLLYTHPAHWTDELIETIRACPKVARYVDIPLQHIHENMLERMRRETSRQYIVDLLNRIRTGVPGITLRTTFIVGFPGETDEYFETLLEFIRETRFERLGVFTYSREERTRASKMGGQIPDRIKRERRERAMAEQQKIAAAISASSVGKRLCVLVENPASAQELRQARMNSWEHGLLRGTRAPITRLKGRFLVARGQADAPDIDGRVYVRGELPVGEFADVEVVGHSIYDLVAEPVSQDRPAGSES